MPLRREAHVQVKILKAPRVWTTLEVEAFKEWALSWREADFQVESVKS